MRPTLSGTPSRLGAAAQHRYSGLPVRRPAGARSSSRPPPARSSGRPPGSGCRTGPSGTTRSSTGTTAASAAGPGAPGSARPSSNRPASRVERLYESVIVQYQDVDGSTRTVGPPGSGANVEDAGLADDDTDNPAVRLGITKRALLTMGVARQRRRGRGRHQLPRGAETARRVRVGAAGRPRRGRPRRPTRRVEGQGGGHDPVRRRRRPVPAPDRQDQLQPRRAHLQRRHRRPPGGAAGACWSGSAPT